MMQSTIEDKYKTLRFEFLKVLSNLLYENKLDKNLLEIANGNCNFPPDYYLLLFPSGIYEIVSNIHIMQDDIMLSYLDQSDIPEKITDRIAKALCFRVTALSPLVYKNISSYHVHSSKDIWNTCDLIWRYAGDTSVDFNYYSKRGLLSTVYISSILFYINDTSANFTNTKNFIINSLYKVVKLGKFIGEIKSKIPSFIR